MRSGIIPYTIYQSRVYFLLGRDRRSRDICDFGGGLKTGETVVQAGLREFAEESAGLFHGVCDAAGLTERCVTLEAPKAPTATPAPPQPKPSAAPTPKWRWGMTIFFVPLDTAWLARAAPAFHERRSATTDRESLELDQIVWVSEKAFLQLVFARRATPPMWGRLRAFLQRAINCATFGAQLRAAFARFANVTQVTHA